MMLKAGQVAHTQKTLNYKIITTFSAQMSPLKTVVLDIHSGKELLNPEFIDKGVILEERYEDLENLVVMKYDYQGNFISQRAFKKSGELVGEIILSDDEIEAMESYDVEDEDLKLQKIDWDRIIFADENFSKEFITRWSDLRDYKVKSEYTRDGLIHRRVAWNKFTGQKVPVDHKIYAQTVKKDLVQNHRGFIEIFYNTLGKVTAIRSWDRKSGRVITPPRQVPFSFRLEKDHLRMNFDQNKAFREDYFRELVNGKELELKDGESLFKEEREKYRLLQSFSVVPYLFTDVDGKVGKNKNGTYRNTNPDAISLRAKWQPGKYPVYTRMTNTDFQSRISGSLTVRNTLFANGADLDGSVTTVDNYVKKTLFHRTDSEVELIGGVRASYHDLSMVDGSRRVAYDELTFQPILGGEAAWYPFSKTRLSASVIATKFHVGGVDTAGFKGNVELRQKVPGSLSRLMDGLEIGVGYQRNDVNMRTDTDSLSEVGFDSYFKGGYVEFQAKF